MKNPLNYVLFVPLLLLLNCGSDDGGSFSTPTYIEVPGYIRYTQPEHPELNTVTQFQYLNGLLYNMEVVGSNWVKNYTYNYTTDLLQSSSYSWHVDDELITEFSHVYTYDAMGKINSIHGFEVEYNEAIGKYTFFDYHLDIGNNDHIAMADHMSETFDDFFNLDLSQSGIFTNIHIPREAMFTPLFTRLEPEKYCVFTPYKINSHTSYNDIYEYEYSYFSNGFVERIVATNTFDESDTYQIDVEYISIPNL